MLLEKAGHPLKPVERETPIPQAGQVLLKVRACGVCRTDLHIADGELNSPKLPLIPGHEIVGTVEALGDDVKDISKGQRVGIPWLGHTCGRCHYCADKRENLCDNAKFTGYTLDGGYAEYTVADHRYCFPLPEKYDDIHAAPLLCAGLIGYRSYRMARDAVRIGLFGFGAAAHIIAQVAIHENKKVFAFTRPGDTNAQVLAIELGAYWAGDSGQPSPEPLDAAIIYAPAGDLVPAALRDTVKGGVVICAGIHMSDIPTFPYAILWGERVVRSVANLTRADGIAFMRAAEEIPIKTSVELFELDQANEALTKLRAGKINGAAVLQISS